MPQAEREQQHPKKLFAQGPQKKKKRRPNPTQSCLCAAPQLKLNLWLGSGPGRWAMGYGLPACQAQWNSRHARPKNKKIKERERSKQSFCCLYKFWIQSSIEKLNGKEEWSAECSYSFLHRHTHTQRHTRAVVCVLYDFLFYFINTFFYFCFFGYAMQSSWAKLEIVATCNLHCPTQFQFTSYSISALSPSLCLTPINVLYWFLNCVVIVVQIIKVFRLCQATLLNYDQTFVFWP